MKQHRRCSVSLALLLAVACDGGRESKHRDRSDGPNPAHSVAGYIPRPFLFGNPERSAARLSRDGKQLAYLAGADGVLNIWVGPLSDPAAARPVTRERDRPVRNYCCAYSGKHILYLQDVGGNERWHVLCVDLETGRITDLTPIDGVAAQIAGASERDPGHVVLAINDRVKSAHDLYKVDIVTGERKLIEKNEAGYSGFVLDQDLAVRFAQKADKDGSNTIYARDPHGTWKVWQKVPLEDSMSTSVLALDKTGTVAYMSDSRGRNTAALTAVNLDTGETSLLAEDARADLGRIVTHPTEETIQAVSVPYARVEWKVLDKSLQGDFDRLATIADGEMNVIDRSQDDRTWLVSYEDDDGPTRWYLWDREKQTEKFLFVNREVLDELRLAAMHPVIVKSRDGLDLVSYLTLPVDADPDGDGKPESPLPMVLLVHGGPATRTRWGFDGWTQLLANRGYAALWVNFRGSTGFGKKFVNAGNYEWGKKMQDDLIDAVNWAVAQGIALEDRICIMGGSYGGYAALMGMTKTPDTFACGVDFVGPSNLVRPSSPNKGEAAAIAFKARVGDRDTEEGRKELLEISPLTHVERIKRPLLIAHGANDPRVQKSESDHIVAAMKEKKIPVTYLLFPDEGHGFIRPENIMAFFAVTEVFLAMNLGGAAQALSPEDVMHSTLQVLEGAEGVPGLRTVLKMVRPEPTAPPRPSPPPPP